MNRPTQRIATVALGLLISLAAGIASAQVTMFGYDHTPLGSATLTPSAASLEVANLGSSGQDGVSVDLSGITLDEFLWIASLNDLGVPASRLPGDFIQLTSHGEVGGTPNQLIGTSRATFAGSDVVLSVDFSHVSTGPLRIEFRQGGPLGILVAEEFVPGNSFSDLRVSGSPNSLSGDIKTVPGPYPLVIPYPTFDFGFSGATDMITPGGTVVTADYLDVFAAAPSMGRFTGVSITAGGMASFSIIGETLIAIPEPSTLVLSTLGALGIGWIASRQRHR